VQDGLWLKKYRGMGSLEAMAKGSDARYLGDKSRLKIAQGVSGSVAAKGSVLRLIPYTLHAVKQGFQDLGTPSIRAAHDALRSGGIRLEVCHFPCFWLGGGVGWGWRSWNVVNQGSCTET
jgi:IMP dehydrogenase